MEIDSLVPQDRNFHAKSVVFTTASVNKLFQAKTTRPTTGSHDMAAKTGTIRISDSGNKYDIPV